MGKVILICGRIGSGKSTYANKLARRLNGVIITQDEIMLGLFGAQFYDNEPEQYAKYCLWVEGYVKQKAGEIAKAGAIAICENGFWPRSERDELKKFYQKMGVRCELHYVDTPEEQRLKNIQARNETVLSGKSNFFFTHEKDIHHYFEIPDEDEIDVRV